MSDVYTPSEDFVFFSYAYGMDNSPFPDMGMERLKEYRKEFYRWLEQHDARVREQFVSLLADRADLAHFVGADSVIYAVPLYAVEDEAEKLWNSQPE